LYSKNNIIQGISQHNSNSYHIITAKNYHRLAIDVIIILGRAQDYYYYNIIIIIIIIIIITGPFSAHVTKNA